MNRFDFGPSHSYRRRYWPKTNVAFSNTTISASVMPAGGIVVRMGRYLVGILENTSSFVRSLCVCR
jgi:hypothetical protein